MSQNDTFYDRLKSAIVKMGIPSIPWNEKFGKMLLKLK